MKHKTLFSFPVVAAACMLLLQGCSDTKENKDHAKAGDNAGLTLPEGFNATAVADNIGPARHLAVSPEGNIFVKLAFPDKEGHGIIFLKATSNAEYTKTGFANYGGTGIYLKNDYLYASSDEDVFRYKLNEKHEVIDPAQEEKIVCGLLDRKQHSSKSIVLDNDGKIYVNIGAFSNSCQQEDRKDGSPGMANCPVLDSAGGIWQFRADKEDQHYSNGVRYATGLRNVVGLDWNTQDNNLYVMQHGRDQLTMFPEHFDDKKNAELPAECMYLLKNGDNAGWPYAYYDPMAKKKMLSPEYGGDGKKEGDAKFIDPVAAYPAHMAPNGLLFYTGNMFPEKYKNGAFIAFHGSWNRAPEPQAGYFVAFQPFRNGKPDGAWEIFADGFSGSKENTASGKAEHRPCGLAQGADGALYVSDDSKGRIYKIAYAK